MSNTFRSSTVPAGTGHPLRSYLRERRPALQRLQRQGPLRPVSADVDTCAPHKRVIQVTLAINSLLSNEILAAAIGEAQERLGLTIERPELR
ncbi:hypothetical protein GCM10011609_28380 [Lentzea pudingi]|uniref:Uncharacterized protein n=1 Tax=Lentzea pudingi TaxID=1789439 RepID=A0ABQ2HRV2_9PSEU|nr:hypothetical protein GCM10011609_28380 [Lentzea pudingi]